MADSIEVKFRGMDKVLKRLRDATLDIQGPAAKRAVTAAARMVAEVTQSNAEGLTRTKGRTPTGTIRRAIIGHWSPKRSKEYLVQVALVRVKSGKKLQKRKKGSQDAYYAGWVEFGHKNVARRKGKYSDLALRGLGRATGIAVRRRAASTSTPAHPFMKPAWNQTKFGAARVIQASLRRSLNRADKAAAAK